MVGMLDFIQASGKPVKDSVCEDFIPALEKATSRRRCRPQSCATREDGWINGNTK
jgi:hypothetical protein